MIVFMRVVSPCNSRVLVDWTAYYHHMWLNVNTVDLMNFSLIIFWAFISRQLRHLYEKETIRTNCCWLSSMDYHHDSVYVCSWAAFFRMIVWPCMVGGYKTAWNCTPMSRNSKGNHIEPDNYLENKFSMILRQISIHTIYTHVWELIIVL